MGGGVFFLASSLLEIPYWFIKGASAGIERLNSWLALRLDSASRHLRNNNIGVWPFMKQGFIGSYEHTKLVRNN